MSKQGIKIINNKALVREVKRLRFVDKMSYRQIASELKIGKTTVGAILQRFGRTKEGKAKSDTSDRIQIIDEVHKKDVQEDILNEEKEILRISNILKTKEDEALKKGDVKHFLKLVSPHIDALKTSGQLKKFNLTLVDARSQHITYQNLSEGDKNRLKLELKSEVVGEIWTLLSEESRRALSE